MFSVKFVLTISLSIASVLGANVSSISICPALAARTAPAKDVTDLRIDDIQVIAALGDSIMAGFGMMGVDYSGSGLMNSSAITEYRGNSYGMGGDPGALTLANFAKNYNPALIGASYLSHFVELCNFGNCTAILSRYSPSLDNLNSAQTGAIAHDLDYELDYLIPRMKSLTSNYTTAWKMITIQIGSNDQCLSCDSNFVAETAAEEYSNYIEVAIKRIQNEIPYTVINLFGTFKVSRVFPLAAKETSYCVPNGMMSGYSECLCSNSAANLTNMDALSDVYNTKLAALAQTYAGKTNDTFAVMYSPIPVNMSSFPITALSNIDCFHPSITGHQWMAKALWNQLFTPLSLKPSTLNFDTNLQIYCPTSSDRLPTTNK